MKIELIEKYHKMTLERVGQGQGIIDLLEGDGEDRESIELVQEALDQTASILLILRNAGAAIDPGLLRAFNALNRSVGEFNKANNATLIQQREIGDVPVEYGIENTGAQHEEVVINTGYQGSNATTPLMGETEDDNDCCGCCSVM
jgi:hypothetical protein